jgi:hypothetical protein
MAFFRRGEGEVGGRGGARAREHLLHGTPLVARDGMVVLVDVTIRFEPAARAGESAPVWESDDEAVVAAVVLAVLRLLAEEHDGAELLAGRSLLSEPLGRAVSYAPVATRFTADVTSMELRTHDPAVRSQSQWRAVQ